MITCGGAERTIAIAVGIMAAATVGAGSDSASLAGGGEHTPRDTAIGSQRPLADTTAAQIPAFTPTRDVVLLQGWNLVGWTAGGSVDFVDFPTATASIAGDFDVLFVWSAADQRFSSFNPSAPFLAGIDALGFAQGIWIFANTDTVWRQGSIDHPHNDHVRSGWNLDVWTGPDGIPAEVAFASLGADLQIAFTWDPTAQAFPLLRPGPPRLPQRPDQPQLRGWCLAPSPPRPPVGSARPLGRHLRRDCHRPHRPGRQPPSRHGQC